MQKHFRQTSAKERRNWMMSAAGTCGTAKALVSHTGQSKSSIKRIFFQLIKIMKHSVNWKTVNRPCDLSILAFSEILQLWHSLMKGFDSWFKVYQVTNGSIVHIAMRAHLAVQCNCMATGKDRERLLHWRYAQETIYIYMCVCY